MGDTLLPRRKSGSVNGERTERAASQLAQEGSIFTVISVVSPILERRKVKLREIRESAQGLIQFIQEVLTICLLCAGLLGYKRGIRHGLYSQGHETQSFSKSRARALGQWPKGRSTQPGVRAWCWRQGGLPGRGGDPRHGDNNYTYFTGLWRLNEICECKLSTVLGTQCSNQGSAYAPTSSLSCSLCRSKNGHVLTSEYLTAEIVVKGH